MSNVTLLDPFNSEAGRTVVAVIGIVIIIGSILASLLLILSTACQRILRVPFYVVMASWALSNLICAALMALQVFILQHGDWPFPRVFCEYYMFVIQAVLLIRLYHMPLAAIVACFSRKFWVWFRPWPWANYVVALVLCLYVWIIFFILAAPYVGSMVLIRSPNGRLECEFRNIGAAIALDSVFLYWVPFLLSFVMLIVWAFLFVRRTRAVPDHVWRRENSEGLILFIVIHVFVVSRLAPIVFGYLKATSLFNWAPDVMGFMTRIFNVVASSDYFLAPFLCLVVVALYRNIFCLPCRGQAEVSDDPPEPAAIPLKSGEDPPEA